MFRLVPSAVCVLVLATGCVKEISSEERLERELNTPPSRQEISRAELRKVSCQDTAAELAQARNENRPETERVTAYVELYESLRKRVATFEEAMTRNPDLHYQEGSEELVAARDLCIQQTADVRVEFESYVRELVNVPTVQELKGGSTLTVARLDFDTLRRAIEVLGPDDKETLLNRVTAAERKVTPTPAAKEPEPPPSPPSRRRGR